MALASLRHSCLPLTVVAIVAATAPGALAQQGVTFEIVSAFQSDEGRPKAIIQTRDGRFFGTSSVGVFAMQTNGARTTVYRFPANSGSGRFVGMPGGLVEGSDGSLYGTTSVPSAYIGSAGEIFRITPDGVTATLASRYLLGGVIVARDGRLYGTVAADTTPFAEVPGFVFRLESDGTLTSLYTTDLLNPSSELVETDDGSLYGPNAGLNRFPLEPTVMGDIFQLVPSPAGGAFSGSVRHTFRGLDGAIPIGRMTQGRDGLVYGTTLDGGFYGYGTVFTIDSAGALTTLHHFTGPEGAFPESGVIQGFDGRLYGTTRSGGDFDYGTVFALDVTGELTTLHHFALSDGADPIDELIQSDDGALYGVAPMGGPGNNGVIFRIRLGTSTPASSEYVEIVSRSSGKCLDLAGGATDAGAAVIQWTCHHGPNQQWRLEPVGGGAVRVVSRYSGQALDVAGGSTTDGAAVVQWPIHGGDNQAWMLEPAPDGYMRLVVRHSGKAMDLEFGSTSDGARVVQWSPHSGVNQQWLLRPSD